MHHFIYPSQDTFISNRLGLVDKNFGVTEILQVGTTNTLVNTLSPTKQYFYVNAVLNNLGVQYFTAIFTGSFSGTVAYASGTISGSGIAFSASYFSGSVNGTGSVGSGSFGDPASGSAIIGLITGSVITVDAIGLFTGTLTGSNGCLTGTASGTDTRNEQNWTTSDTQYVDRALLQFNISAISASIASGAITNPSFVLRLKNIISYQLPIAYTIYALPVSQSWEMGNGYLSDGGSPNGANWLYRDNDLGTNWYSQSFSGSVRPPIDFIDNPGLVTASFAYGGGTFYTASWCSQSFNYEASDINMNITPMVMAWISGSIPNQGVMLVSSDELIASGSGFILKFYSEDTNTIYWPFLDAAWDDVSATYNTGSFLTASVTMSTVTSGITASVQSGSTFSIAGGVSGSFSSSVFLTVYPNYITASNQTFNSTTTSSTLANDTWYANNGYHFDSWFTAWDLDPYSGGFLPGTDVQFTAPPVVGNQAIVAFTGSFTGSFYGTASVNGTISGSAIFTVDFFTGSIDASSSVQITSGSVSGSFISGSIIGTVVPITYVGTFQGQLSASSVFLNGTGTGYYLDNTYQGMIGFTDGTGLTGNIANDPVFGNFVGLLSLSQSLVVGMCGTSFSASLAKATFTNGIFSGSTFVAYYLDGKFENALLTGSWNPQALYGATVYIPIPSGMDPYAYAYVTGAYASGTALGLYQVSGSTSASFAGQFVSGELLGGYLNLQLSGSVYTSSFTYTSSVQISSSFFTPLDTTRGFTVTCYNLKPEYRTGDIAKVDVFGRIEFPLKYFGKATQQEQYLVPQFLPSASFYALKDNDTGEIVMDFDSYTRIGCSYPEGNFFLIDTTSLPQERYYRILIKVEDGQSVYTFDTGKTFKITR